MTTTYRFATWNDMFGDSDVRSCVAGWLGGDWIGEFDACVDDVVNAVAATLPDGVKLEFDERVTYANAAFYGPAPDTDDPEYEVLATAEDSWKTQIRESLDDVFLEISWSHMAA